MESLLSTLTLLVSEHLARSRGIARRREGQESTKPEIDIQAQTIAEGLISEAVAHGFQATVTRVTPERLAEGNTAQIVARIHMPLSFVFKLDDSSELIEEARLMLRFREDHNLPATFRECFPQVFALKDDDKPFAYLMEDFAPEDGYESLSRRLFRSQPRDVLPAASLHLINEVLDAVFEGYAQSANRRLLPNISADYLDRIRERLSEAADLNEAFQSAALTINGVELLPWGEQLDQIAAMEEKLRQVSPPFLCAVHGDPNPENIMLKIEGERVTVKLIDPKAWERGDYLFDLTKIAHYLWATGPVEHASGGRIDPPKGLVVCYSIERADWLIRIVELIHERALKFAEMHNDTSRVDLRWELGMASNLLGLPPGRWKSKKHDEARIYYAEGMLWLDGFRRKLWEL
jgi:hypothetical protein